MKRQTWHFLFYKSAFTKTQIDQLLAYLKQQQNFGGFPIVELIGDGDSSDIRFVTMIFDPLSPINARLQSEMAKFMLMHAIRPDGNTAEADMRLYGRVMGRSDTELGIEFQRYDDQNMDVIYWGQHNSTH
ncbi:hypothetical protein [Latilactobacillus graminis]|uniref:Uncharacterized protein n=2 Tax=Latilactobacillus graminis TaxID=60519 RepID=A0AA89I1U1_9LACO|nr:hypothetical protein [Latilactobacillus graminis]KRM24018.1 hypothetical protein FC90_GL001261 [Latilactobacillus graminis DSM 20719]